MEGKYTLTKQELVATIDLVSGIQGFEKELYSKSEKKRKTTANYLMRVALKDYEEKVPQEVRDMLSINVNELRSKCLEVLLKK